MMEYQVPQFIEVEDKIVGPFTLKQFIYLAGTVGLCILFLFYLPLVFALILCAPVAALGGSLAFYKVNGKPLIEILEAGFNYYVGPKLFLWKRPEAKAAAKAAAPAPTPTPVVKSAPLTRGKLSELAWSLDVKKSSPEELES